ncbi:MAG: cobaltochelatase subunit CobN, partial [Planctomycetaceae bacterium]|nr:cobaltochelatase subunit CobN [Planctomycetaceae bacterium]
LGYYRDMLPTRMKLLDKAIRLVAETEEEANYLFQNSQQAYQEFLKKGIEDNSAKRLSQARIFGGPPGQFGSAGYYYLVERSGEWDTREDLMETYLSFSRHVYTEGAWGEDAPDIYDRHIQGTEILLRSWSDRTRSPLSNKYDWYKGGSLSLAIKHLTGKEPEWFLSDVRDPDNASMVDAEAALRQDYRVRLFNRKWIEGMMKEGYAGADQISVHVSNTLGWKIMRENSVSEDIWEEIVDVYIRDKKNLHIREWFEAENPFAYQEMNEILLETVRKGYWQPGEETLREIAVEYARSVARHGEGGGLRGGGNVKLESFVEEILTGPGDPQLAELFAQYDEKSRETQEVDSSPANTLLTSAEIEAVPDSDMQTNEPIEQKENSTSEQTASQTEMVEGRELVPQDNETKNRENEKQVQEWLSVSALILFVALLLVLLGYLRHGKNHSK